MLQHRLTLHDLRYFNRNETRWSRFGSLVIFSLVFGLGFLVNFAEAATFKLFWGWIIVDMFPNAVSQGLIVNSLSWVITLKIAVFFTIIRLIKALDKAYAKSKEP